MKNGVFWDVTSCGSCKNRCFGGTYSLQHQGEKNLRAISSQRQLLVAINIVPSSLILFTLMLEAFCSTETSVPTRDTRHHIPEDGILHLYQSAEQI
jgi:hypothetical protein